MRKFQGQTTLEELAVRRANARQTHPRLPAAVEVIDCTLRDGEQAAGVWFTPAEKLMLARMLDDAGVSVLDAGFPAACEEEVEILQELRRANLRARIAATARPVISDIVAAERARAEEVFVFLATSELRLGMMGLTREQAERRLREGVEEALSRGMTVNVVAEDAFRADRDWLCGLLQRMLTLPVRRVVVCDTVGAALPHEMEQLVVTISDALGPDVTLCMHCHNDFGLAGANTLAGVMGGARAVSCTVNGLGERAGNADFAEVTAALEHLLGVEHEIDPKRLPELAAAVERASGVHTSPLKAVTGWNVYHHESGVHVDGLLADPRSYEFLPPTWTGQSSKVVLGKHSGISSIAHVLRHAGLTCHEPDLRALLALIKSRSSVRQKNRHGITYDAMVDFRSHALHGVDPDVVLLAVGAQTLKVSSRG